jgi:hypothetical protein
MGQRSFQLKFILQLFITLILSGSLTAQLRWKNVDSIYQPLPGSVHVYFSDDSLDNGPFRAFYLVADLKDKKLDFTVDTSKDRRLTPQFFFERNGKALVVVNTTFFSYETNRSLNIVIKDGILLSTNSRKVKGKGADSVNYHMPSLSAIGIDYKRKADVAWIKSDTSSFKVLASQSVPVQGSLYKTNRSSGITTFYDLDKFKKWKVKTAVGGGPTLLQNGEIKISNEEERIFTGKAINDKHPRTAMGYTKDGKLIILVIEGRNPKAAGATLTQEAQIFKDLDCWEALNLDGGGSSCLLINGKETIKPSDKEGQRPIPAALLIKHIK